jgi:NAD(P)-dependent dehydrogenase (short-subunit alcohol dehydrogenase family)
MDHLSLASVVSAAKHFLSLEASLHGLVNNAGIMATPYLETADGYEAQLQTNYLAHWVFTAHLLPTMLRTAKGLPAGSVRIGEVSSSAHLGAPKGGIVFEDKLSLKEPAYDTWRRYAQSKLANILHMKTIHTLYGPGSPSAKAGSGEIWTASVHPGLTTGNSGLQSHMEETPMWVKVANKLVGTDSDTASYSSIFCAASPDMKAAQSGSYFSLRSAFADPGFERKEANDPKLAAKLDEWTKKEMEAKGFAPSS